MKFNTKIVQLVVAYKPLITNKSRIFLLITARDAVVLIESIYSGNQARDDYDVT